MQVNYLCGNVAATADLPACTPMKYNAALPCVQ